MGRRYVLALTFTMLLLAHVAYAANCTLSGTVLNVDTTPCVNCTIMLNPVTSQPLTTGGATYTSQPVSTTTDVNGAMTPVSLPQGLIVNVTISENGATFGGYTAIVPFMASATFTQMNQGISTNPLNVLASSQPPTGPLSMNNQKITSLACGTTSLDALSWGCDATVGALTTTGSFTAGGGFAIGSGLAVSGRLSDAPLGVVSAPVVTPLGTTGATAYSYFIVCHDGATGASAVSAAGSTATGNAMLDSTNKNHIVWVRPTGYVDCDVLRANSTHSIALAQTGTTWDDTQNGAGSVYVPPTRNTTGLMGYAGTGTQGHMPTFERFPATGTYTTPSWAPSALRVTMAAGGGGGGGATSGVSTNAGSGGGSGAITQCYIPSPSGTYAVTVGAGGTAGTCSATPVDATSGGVSSFIGPTFCTAAAGVGGGTSAPAATPAGALGGAAVATTFSAVQTGELISSTAGANGTDGDGGAAVPGVGGIRSGGNGGSGATVTGTSCTGAATAGKSGWVLIEAIP